MNWQTEVLPSCVMCERGIHPSDDNHAFKGLTVFPGLEDEKIFMEYDMCPHCGLIFQHAMPTEESLENLYSTSMYRKGSKEPFLGEILIERRRARHFLPLLLDAKVWPETEHREEGIPPAHLDIGSSTGAFGALLRAYGTESTLGVEPGPWAEYSLKDLHEVFRDIDSVPKTFYHVFDLVTVSHVIEHERDPVAFLLKCRRFLKPGGRMLIALPDFHRPWTSVFAFPHLLVFTPRVFQSLLRLAGFKVERRKFFGPDQAYLVKLAKPKYTIHPNFPGLMKKYKFMRRLYDRSESAVYWGNSVYRPQLGRRSPRILGKVSHVLRQWNILFGGIYSVALFVFRRTFLREKLLFYKTAK